MERIKIEDWDCYQYAKKRGYEPLIDKHFKIEEPFKRILITEMFGSGNTEAQNLRFYRWIWEHKPHYCEECLRPLREYSSVYCSHILSRGAYPEFAYYPDNVNILCFKHHQQWENGKRETMRIYDRNMRIIRELKNDYNVERK